MTIPVDYEGISVLPEWAIISGYQPVRPENYMSVQEEGKTVWVILWRYHDGSDSNVLCRCYETEERALQDIKLLEDAYNSKKYELVALPLLK
jgi:hypothetical protein